MAEIYNEAAEAPGRAAGGGTRPPCRGEGLDPGRAGRSSGPRHRGGVGLADQQKEIPSPCFRPGPKDADRPHPFSGKDQ